MTDVGRHPRIKLHTLTEVTDVKGVVGNFKVKLLKKARNVKEKECTSCGECVKVCPVVRPDEFNLGLSSRRAIYSPFPQAVPAAYVVNINECLGHNPSVCSKCVDVCATVSWFSLPNFRRHIGKCARRRPAGGADDRVLIHQAGQAKIAQQHAEIII